MTILRLGNTITRRIKEGDLMRFRAFCIITTTAIIGCLMSKNLKSKVNTNCCRAKPMEQSKHGLGGRHKSITLGKKGFEYFIKGKKSAKANNPLISFHFQWNFDFGDGIKPRK